MLTLDPRLRTALRNDIAAQSLLNDLHQQILRRPHPSVLSRLLGEYVATAAARGGATESTLFAFLSNLSKSAHDTAKAMIQNLRA
jgi:hypothetical protein